jgi:molecular chaperone IbpA
MRDFDFAPFSRASIGFDRMFNALESSLRLPEGAGDWPPYNIRRTGDGSYRLELAVAGYTTDEISIVQQQNALVVTGKKPESAGEFLHRGITGGNFERRFSLADFIRVVGADLANGILSIDLAREVPEAMKPRKINIGNGPQTVDSRAA